MSKPDPFKLIDMADELRRVFELEGFTPALRWARDLEGRAGMILEGEGIAPDTGMMKEEKHNDD